MNKQLWVISLALTCVVVCFCCCCVNFWIYQWWTYKTHCFLFSKLPDIQCLSSLSIGRTKESTCYDLQLPWVPLKIRASWLLLLLLLSLLLLLPLIFYLSFLYFHCLSLLFFLNPYSFFFYLFKANWFLKSDQSNNSLTLVIVSIQRSLTVRSSNAFECCRK